MKLLIDIKENKAAFILELLKSLDCISILKEVRNREKSLAIEDLSEAFEDVKLYEQGKRPLKSANDFLNEL